MSEYEITYIIDGKASDEARDQLAADFERQVADIEGKIAHASAALRRQLAYPIKRERTGFLRVVNLTLDPSRLMSLQQFLSKHEHVLRFTVLNTPYREELPADVMRSVTEAAAKPRASAKKPAKKVTMEDVEKGIEEALTEDVK